MTNNTRTMQELIGDNQFSKTKKSKAWYVPYRLVADDFDNYNTVIRPDGCVNVKAKTWKNIRCDTTHNQIETAGTIHKLLIRYNEEIQSNELIAIIKYSEDNYLTDSKGNKIMIDSQGNDISNSILAYEQGIIKGVSIEFGPIETATENITKRTIYTKWVLYRVAILTTLTADIPGQPYSGELPGAIYRDLQLTTKNDKYNDMTITVSTNSKRCLCNADVGAFGRSNLDNIYVEIMSIDQQDDEKIFTLRNVLTNDTFTTKYDDHYDEITFEEVATRIQEIIDSISTSRSYSEDGMIELRACQACQAKMVERQKKLAEFLQNREKAIKNDEQTNYLLQNQNDKTQENVVDDILQEVKTYTQDLTTLINNLDDKISSYFEVISEQLAQQAESSKQNKEKELDFMSELRNFVGKNQKQLPQADVDEKILKQKEILARYFGCR